MRAVSGGARVGAVLWILGLQVFVFEQLAQRAWTPAYSVSRNYVSDLGIERCSALMCSPLHAWLNASFVVQGLLFLAGIFLLRRSFPPLPESLAFLLFLSVSAVGIIAAGLMPAGEHHFRHVAAGGLCFSSGSVAMIMYGLVLLNGQPRRPLAGWLSIACGVAVATATFILLWRGGIAIAFLMPYIGLVERVPAYLIPAWVAAAGVGLLVAEDGAAACQIDNGEAEPA